jgi:hypothetical protein
MNIVLIAAVAITAGVVICWACWPLLPAAGTGTPGAPGGPGGPGIPAAAPRHRAGAHYAGSPGPRPAAHAADTADTLPPRLAAVFVPEDPHLDDAAGRAAAYAKLALCTVCQEEHDGECTGLLPATAQLEEKDETESVPHAAPDVDPAITLIPAHCTVPGCADPGGHPSAGHFWPGIAAVPAPPLTPLPAPEPTRAELALHVREVLRPARSELGQWVDAMLGVGCASEHWTLPEAA